MKRNTLLLLALCAALVVACDTGTSEYSDMEYHKSIRISNVSGQGVTLTVKGQDYFVADKKEITFNADEWAWYSPVYRPPLKQGFGGYNIYDVVYTADTVALTAADGTRALHFRAKDSTFHPAAHNIVDADCYVIHHMMNGRLITFEYAITPYDLNAVD